MSKRTIIEADSPNGRYQARISSVDTSLLRKILGCVGTGLSMMTHEKYILEVAREGQVISRLHLGYGRSVLNGYSMQKEFPEIKDLSFNEEGVSATFRYLGREENRVISRDLYELL